MVYNRLVRRLRTLGLDDFGRYLSMLEANQNSAEWQAFVARRNFSHRNALNYAPQQTSEKPVLRTVQIKTPRSLSHSNDEAGNLR
ncbi:cheR methyltransferase, all-alpha domain protein [Enterobacter roggenkampii]|nr:cheR methyltransferase, all-alpha domain protein [Enterobacter roggenkampii]